MEQLKVNEKVEQSVDWSVECLVAKSVIEMAGDLAEKSVFWTAAVKVVVKAKLKAALIVAG